MIRVIFILDWTILKDSVFRLGQRQSYRSICSTWKYLIIHPVYCTASNASDDSNKYLLVTPKYAVNAKNLDVKLINQSPTSYSTHFTDLDLILSAFAIKNAKFSQSSSSLHQEIFKMSQLEQTKQPSPTTFQESRRII